MTPIGIIGAGLIALIITLGRGWLLHPGQVEANIKQWEHLYTGMERDRDYWRAKAHELQGDAQQALDIAEESGGDDDAS